MLVRTQAEEDSANRIVQLLLKSGSPAGVVTYVQEADRQNHYEFVEVV